VAGKRDAEANGDRQLRDFACAAQEGGEFVGEGIFCAGDTGAGDEIKKAGRNGGDFGEALVGGSRSAEKNGVEMMGGKDAAMVFGLFGREVGDEDCNS